MTNKEKILDILSKKNGVELIQLSKEFGDAFQLSENTNTQPSEDNKELLDIFSKLNLNEIIEIRNDLMSKHNIQLSDISAIQSMDSGANSGVAAEAELVKAILKTIPDTGKTTAIKNIRDMFQLSISESSTIVKKVMEGEECVLKDKLTPAQANEIIEKFKKDSIIVITKPSA